MSASNRKQLVKEQLEALPTSNKARSSDGSAMFKLVGGEYHDITVRSYAPWEDIVFPNGDRYRYSPEPVGRRSKAHVYMAVN